ncbi:unnamed protein product [Mytilus edulis]|uniref:MAM domain-containing protein n=1 Tax=Mytilus edulis TaxID=6550 RepID=A0A8S3Q8D7_MYTED|nr:unnamed protein product [Mytilus edulis]
MWGLINLRGTVNDSCTFENDLCGWAVSSNGTYQWIRGRRKSPGNSTGPDRDTTASGDGYYIYTMSETGSQPNEETDLLSGLIGPSPRQCLTFWYHMYGEHINTLKVFQLNDNRTVELWNESANQGNKWYYQSLSLNGAGPYRIMFTAIRGNGSKSEIAIDDISITNTDCKKVFSLDCNFETDTCNWNIEHESEYMWTVIFGGTHHNDTRPVVDHTYGFYDGNYIYLNASNIEPGQKSNFTSVTVSSEGDACFTFWFHMYGNENGTLNVYLVSENLTEKLWSRSGNEPDLWQLAFVDISMLDPHNITLEGVRGSTKRSDIAVDDISLLPGSCNKRDHPDTLRVYIQSRNTTQLRWSQNETTSRQWKFAYLTISESEPYRIIFEGVRRNGFWSVIAIDDISLLDRSCSGLIKTAQKCHNIDESISLHECSKHYLQLNDTSLVFDPQFDNCSTVYQAVQTSVTTVCNNMNNSEICTFDLPEPKMEDQRCFHSNWLSVEYKCEAEVPSTSKGSSEGKKNCRNNCSFSIDIRSRLARLFTGLIVGSAIGSFVLVFIVAVICLIRRFLMEKYNLEKIENLQGNDNTGHQTIALQQSSSPPQYEVLQSTNNQYACTNIAMTNSNEIINNVQFEDERKQIAPLENETRNKNETKVNQYDVIDPTVITSSCRSTEDKSVETENHTVLDQKETELDRSKMSDETQSYDVTRTINAVGPHACAGFHSRDDETVVTKSENESQHIVPLEVITKEINESKGNQYEEIDPTAITSVCHSIGDKPRETENNTVLDQKGTESDRSKLSDKTQSYDLTRTINAEHDNSVMSKVGPHACAGGHLRDDKTVVTETDDESKHIAPLEDETKGKFETKGNQYEEIDHIANISVWHSTEDKPNVINNYTVLDPKETGFDRSKIINNKQSYELAKPVRAENDEYGMSKEGTYDCAGRSNHKDLENIYNHAIDNVYDSGSHERKDFGNENAYDHFVRQKDGR